MKALVLAGGTNKRYGAVKSFIKVNDRRIIDTNIQILRKIFTEVIISTNDPEKYFHLGVPMVGDIVRDKGPMSGILSVLMLPRVDSVFVTACDMPFIHIDLTTALDCADRADGLAGSAPGATFGVPLKPIKHSNPAKNGQSPAERAGETTVNAFNE